MWLALHVPRALRHDGFVAIAARIGFAAKAVVYAVVGWLAIQSAFSAGRTTGSAGVLARLTREPHGEVLVLLMTIGLAAYAFWRFVECFADPDRKGTAPAQLAVRGGYLTSGIIHAALVVWAFRLLSGDLSWVHAARAPEDGARELTARLLSTRHGIWLVALAGVAFVGAGVREFFQGYGEDFRKRLNLAGATERRKEWIRRAGKLGLIARGIVLGIMGAFLVFAAYQADPKEARGLGDTLRSLEEAPYGPFVLAAVGIGLLFFSLFNVALARYRKFVGL
jgi:hypothetical protein